MNFVTVQDRHKTLEEIDQFYFELRMKAKTPEPFHLYVYSYSVERKTERGEYITLIPIKKPCRVRRMQIWRPLMARVYGTVVFIDMSMEISNKDMKALIGHHARGLQKPKVVKGGIYLPQAALSDYNRIWSHYFREDEGKNNVVLDFYAHAKKEFPSRRTK